MTTFPIRKTLIKTLSYAAMHMSIAVLVSYLVSRSWEVAFAIGLLEPCVQTTAFFFHERVWLRIEGRKAVHHHDSVIDSVSPIARVIEKFLYHRH